MPTDSSAGRRALPPVPTIPSQPTLPRLITWALQIVNWLIKLRDNWAGVPGGWKDTAPNPTGTASDSGTEDAGWMAADATVKQGIVTTKGDILTHSTVPAALGVGANTRVLLADSSQTTGLRWADQTELSQAGGGWARAFMFGSQPDTIFPLRGPAGAVGTPSYSFYASPTTGIYSLNANGLAIAANGIAAVVVNPTANPGCVSFGGVDVTAPGTSTWSGADRATGQTDGAGGAVNIRSGASTGAGAPGNLNLQITPPASGSGSSQNSFATAIQVQGSDGSTLVGGLDYPTAPGTSIFAGVDRAAGVSDGSGGPVTIRGGQSTGTGTEGTVKIQLSPAAASTATTQNALRDVELWDVGSLADPQTTDVTLTGNNGGTMVRKCFSELLTLSTSGTTTDTAANLLPAGSIILSVTTRVTTTISGGGVAAFSVGDATTAARFSASAGGLTAGSTRIGLQHQQGSVATDAAGPVQTSAAAVRITADATPTAGVVRVAVWALVFTAPSS